MSQAVHIGQGRVQELEDCVLLRNTTKYGMVRFRKKSIERDKAEELIGKEMKRQSLGKVLGDKTRREKL